MWLSPDAFIEPRFEPHAQPYLCSSRYYCPGKHKSCTTPPWNVIEARKSRSQIFAVAVISRRKSPSINSSILVCPSINPHCILLLSSIGTQPTSAHDLNLLQCVHGPVHFSLTVTQHHKNVQTTFTARQLS